MRVITTLFMTLVIPMLYSQEYIDPLKLYFATSPNTGYDGADGTTSINEYGGEIMVPRPFGDGHAVILGVHTELTTLMPEPNTEVLNLYTIGPRLGVLWQHNEKWSGQYVLLPQIASDLKGFGWNDVQMGAIGIVSYKKSERTQYRFGAFYNSALYGPAVFAVLGFYHKSENKKWTWDFRLPIDADINYKINNKFSTGIHFDAMLRSYYLNDPLFNSSNEYIVKSTQEPFLYMNYSPAKNFVFMLKLGHSAFRHYRMFDTDDKVDFVFTGATFNDNRTQLNHDQKDNFILQLRFHYRFFLDDQKR